MEKSMKTPFHAVVLTILFAVMVPIQVQAAVSDWYGTWQQSFTGSDSGTCSLTVGAGNASQANLSVSCTISGIPYGTPDFSYSGSGFITANGSFGMSGTLPTTYTGGGGGQNSY